MGDIYNDNTYISNNPNLHREDSDFKFDQIARLFEVYPLPETKVKILDVGGGAGDLGYKVAEYFVSQGLSVEFVALDLSSEMLSVQAKCNPHIDRTLNCSIQDCPEDGFDIVLMIDVIEHVPEKDAVARRLNEISKFIVYNIPIEINAVDLIRNVKMGGRLYAEQTRSIGHVHFFSFAKAKRFIDKHHLSVERFFRPYYDLMLESQAPQYVEVRKSRYRRTELKFSRWVDNNMPWLSSRLLQGSMYALVAAKTGDDHS